MRFHGYKRSGPLRRPPGLGVTFSEAHSSTTHVTCHSQGSVSIVYRAGIARKEDSIPSSNLSLPLGRMGGMNEARGRPTRP